MPLKTGHSKKAVSSNIGELLGGYKEKGKIGNITPKSIAHAKKIAAAIAFKQARKSAKGKKSILAELLRKHK